MRRSTSKKTYILSVLLVLVIAVSLIGFLARRQPDLRYYLVQTFKGLTSGATAGQNPERAGSRPPASWFLISRNAPAFTSSEVRPASDANDDSYDTAWWAATTPAWLAYDLSRVPASRRSKVLVAWYNETFNYDHTIIIGYPAYNMPENYTIEVNPAPGGGHPPDTGWRTLVTVKGNHYHSRQHVIDMTGNNWIRINVTAVDGSVENYNPEINMDVYDASYAATDDWMFFGDSITAGAMGHSTIDGVKAFAQLINAHTPASFPAQEGGGIAYLTSGDGAKYINRWLELFPGRYVGLSYGTNDALGCENPHQFYNNYVTMVQATLHTGKIPVIPHIPWGRATNIQNCAPALNAEIDTLYKTFPQIIKGPDLWTFFRNHQNLISKDNIHPTEAGEGAYRQQWADAMLKEVYTRGQP